MMRLLRRRPRQRRILFFNAELALSRKPVEGSYAQKIAELVGRCLLYLSYDIVVLPVAPSKVFSRYLRKLLPNVPVVFVPRGIDLQHLSIRDGFSDRRLRRLMKGAIVESYVQDEAIKRFVEGHGGTYIGGSAQSVAYANDKSRFGKLAEYIVATPDGETHEGIEDIVTAAMKMLQHGSVIVRNSRGGGGLGTAVLLQELWQYADFESIRREVEGDQADMWRRGAKALVQPYLDIVDSPSVTFVVCEGIRGALYATSQILKGHNYLGFVSPLPPTAGGVSNEALIAIGDMFAQKLFEKGYRGHGGVDLMVARDGEVYGAECNGRKTGTEPGIEAVEGLTGIPWGRWQAEGVAAIVIDHLEDPQCRSFEQLLAELRYTDLLVSKSQKEGIMITIPPNADGVFGMLAVVADGDYQHLEATFRHALRVLGVECPDLPL